ncbi:phospho-N-acetylmuramoyl-pentapeptide-transferase [Coleofasciculus sp. LEGE 07081]|uniref:phospho-N-acetylmuramoyl-pentapeptide- transferase n=1 Tax=unclassified Coleofasciculus TaxID=2692782 RepID=UPI001880CC9F|nr:phospho-N-acetylmuramoyl-pentapeptide-transferase [Coleofasciculus sp. LEGE 07081]MBE9149118.1 phospho-N-acetylmuramoyl-pentapeptide-transferase [Coleofasciculus sp. LEGE 07092]
MDAKLTSGRSISLTGSRLLTLLAVSLSLGALILDWVAGRTPLSGLSITLPLWVCALLTAALGYWVVPFLQTLKLGQIIREDGPQTHLQKAGTPTMGGVFFVPVAVIVALLWSALFGAQNFISVLVVSVVTLGYAGIGWLDDWQIIRRRSNKGISPRMKLALQVSVGLVFCLWLAASQPASMTTINLPLGLVLPLGALFWPLALFVLVAESNATNLTDGVDGLAAGTCAIALLALAAIVAPTSPGLMIFCACMSGSCLGFVVHNRNPATVFMGDTGSLALGGALASVGLLSQNLWCLFVISGLFFVESISVIAQVGYYKATKGPDGIGKRLFKMSPFHNHLELSGWSETYIVGVFYLINGILALIALAGNPNF